MRWHVVLVPVVLGFLLTGCLAKPISSRSVAGGILVEIWVSSDNPQPGDKIKIRLTVTNEGSQAHIVELKDQPVLDIAIDYRTRNESIVIRRSDSRVLTSDLMRLDLKPGESKSIEMDWVVDQRTYGQTVGISGYFVYDAKSVDDPVHPVIVIPVGPYLR